MTTPAVHIEVTGKDGDRLKAFYGELFDWKLNSDNPQNYGMVENFEGSSITGGVGQAQDGSPGMVTFYVETADVGRTLARAAELGGSVVLEATAINHDTTIGMVADPEGHVVGVFQSA